MLEATREHRDEEAATASAAAASAERLANLDRLRLAEAEHAAREIQRRQSLDARIDAATASVAPPAEGAVNHGSNTANTAVHAEADRLSSAPSSVMGESR